MFAFTAVAESAQFQNTWRLDQKTEGSLQLGETHTSMSKTLGSPIGTSNFVSDVSDAIMFDGGSWNALGVCGKSSLEEHTFVSSH